MYCTFSQLTAGPSKIGMAQHDALQEECVDAEVPGVQNVAKYWGLLE